MSQNPYDAQRPSERRSPVIAGELSSAGSSDPWARSYDPLADPSGARRPQAAPLQPYVPPPGHPGAGPVPVFPMPEKSVGVAFVLTFFFGPLGMLYSTVSGALIMLGIVLGVSVLTGVAIGLITLVTLGVGAVLTVFAPLVGIALWIASILWGCLAASSHNQRVREQFAAAQHDVAQHQAAQHQAAQHQAAQHQAARFAADGHRPPWS